MSVKKAKSAKTVDTVKENVSGKTNPLSASTEHQPAPTQSGILAPSEEKRHPKPMPTVEQIDKHLNDFGTIVAAANAPSMENPPLAAVYTAVRPVLLLVEGLLFFKPKWQTAIKILIAGLDAEYPTATNL